MNIENMDLADAMLMAFFLGVFITVLIYTLALEWIEKNANPKT